MPTPTIPELEKHERALTRALDKIRLADSYPAKGKLIHQPKPTWFGALKPLSNLLKAR